MKEPNRINTWNVQKYKHNTFKLVACCKITGTFVVSVDKHRVYSIKWYLGVMHRITLQSNRLERLQCIEGLKHAHCGMFPLNEWWPLAKCMEIQMPYFEEQKIIYETAYSSVTFVVWNILCWLLDWNALQLPGIRSTDFFLTIW